MTWPEAFAQVGTGVVCMGFTGFVAWLLFGRDRP